MLTRALLTRVRTGRRVLTSADQLAPVRYSLQQLGISEINRIVFEEKDATQLLRHVQADIHTGLWSCCRFTSAHAPGCMRGAHTLDKFLCMLCGVLCGKGVRSRADCMYHPGACRERVVSVGPQCCV